MELLNLKYIFQANRQLTTHYVVVTKRVLFERIKQKQNLPLNRRNKFKKYPEVRELTELLYSNKKMLTKFR